MRHPKWTTVWNGRVYRPTMRLMHRLGWCYPQQSGPEQDSVWCHWCGMRGRRPDLTGYIPGQKVA